MAAADPTVAEDGKSTYLGLDFGTSSARATLIDAAGQVCHEGRVSYSGNGASDPEAWGEALANLLADLPAHLKRHLRALAIDGTSGTVLLCGQGARPLLPPLMYNDPRSATQAKRLAAIAPAEHVVLSASSSLAKLLWFSEQPEYAKAQSFMHQADWLASLLHGGPGISDYHNALKLGYDVEALAYPGWLAALPQARLLPPVVVPGANLGTLDPAVVKRFNLPADCIIRAGTTDSIAAFLAAGATQPGEAVTSLGSTLVLKLLSTRRVESGKHGIYSHRLGNLWLTGGASNAGGTVLRQFFTDAQLTELSSRIDPARESPLDYYPLPATGERFPTNDPTLKPRLDPRPADDVAFLHGLLESLARIEAQGYRLLNDFGASPLRRVLTAGGGARNSAWTAIRQRRLGVPVSGAIHSEASYGTALLAQRGENLLA